MLKVTKQRLEEFLKIKSEYLIAKNIYEYLLTSRPAVINLGKVRGSDSNFPYCERSFTIDGADEKELKKYESKVDDARIDMENKKYKYEELKIDVDIFIMQIPNERHREIVKMIYMEDVKKVDVARRCHYSQPRITQIIKEYTEK
jgi:DNA-directed RNA polymerase specialized sigma subunit